MARAKSHSYQKHITHITIGLIALAILLFHFCSAPSCVYAVGGPSLTIIEPIDGARFLEGEEVVISFFVSGRAPIAVSTYLSRGTDPTGQESINRQEGVDRYYSWTVPASMLEEGTYYWYSTATDRVGTTTIPLKSFTIYRESTAEAQVVETAEDRESSTGGKGGHQSDYLGEKTAFFYAVHPGQSAEVSFSHNVKTHGIRSLTFHAIDSLPGGNGFLVHQEFDAFFHYHPEQGVDSALTEADDEIVHPFFYGLPTDITPYKAIHIHDTDGWDEDGIQFSTTIRFEISKKWLEARGLSSQNVSLQHYQFSSDEWVRMQVIPEGEGEFSYYYRTTLNGLPPFVIGGSPDSYYGGIITPSEK